MEEIKKGLSLDAENKLNTASDQLNPFEYLRIIESSLYEESKKKDRLLPFIQEIDSALKTEDYGGALQLIDELEELMDLEFCEPKPISH